MTAIIASSIAFSSTAAFIALWFWVVRKELKAKQNMVEGAQVQLAASRMHCLKARDAPEAQKALEILDRSHDIYRQSLELYHMTLRKPWNLVPGFLMGFRRVTDNSKGGGII